ncbi:MBL fold metallo-hydrolase [Phormidium sp. LEGE 05292]|uniref:MBL fold metallo-hydrolase n=1 Tax=[Phormidium] sp. LEGE 05292 TaxID=767427 RepID=UPI001880A62E|nr:MBL fold metallo-hydrolase [Phormidium sp. LEGE 05292]MBE9225544.1 MBL fold metallo-hydrolase [Phormidium sp. LEGE 05292]
MSKLARAVLDTISAFPPNRDTLGATAYLIVENQTHILVDCPAWDQENQQFLQEQGGVSWLIITHRGGIGKVKEIQAAFGCQILIQEQEAYLLPDLEVTTFEQEFNLTPQIQVIWTPGHSPGSSCVYSSVQGGVLFSGRHLLPNQQGLPVPLRTSKTFHWRRQLRSVALLRDRFSPNTLNYLCPGANTGFLRGKRVIEQAYQHLAALDLEAMLETQPLI